MQEKEIKGTCQGKKKRNYCCLLTRCDVWKTLTTLPNTHQRLKKKHSKVAGNKTRIGKSEAFCI